ncbi:hypothetical protein E2C01_085185 [Portunus trituberculatus]|uniref:Uncharacterized protein n=1 Tax=Portunus trituberculatus TaxID=210409 RepID=A0A5B7IX84_PORTR|nr:hypothetical protein [Portunus trituberculatus]
MRQSREETQPSLQVLAASNSLATICSSKRFSAPRSKNSPLPDVDPLNGPATSKDAAGIGIMGTRNSRSAQNSLSAQAHGVYAHEPQSLVMKAFLVSSAIGVPKNTTPPLQPCGPHVTSPNGRYRHTRS